MKNNKRDLSLRKVINNDKSLIIFVIILAVIIWTVTSLNIGTDETRTINIETPIKLSDELSKQVGMNYYTLKDTVDLSVTISGAKYVIGTVTEDDLNIKFDTSNVNRAGEQTIPILVTNKSKTKDFTITATYPSSLDAYFDVDETKTFDIQLKYDEDAAADGYIFGTPLLSEDKLVISGPTTYVDKIESVGVEIKFDKDAELTEPYNTESSLILNGSGIEQSYLTMTSKTDSSTQLKQIMVTLPVLKQTVLPIEAELDNLPSGLKESDYSVSYSVSQIEAGVLESADVKSAVVGRIDFNEITLGTNTFKFDISNAQGFTPLDESVKEVTVKVKISDDFEKKAVAIDPSKIQLSGGSGKEKVKSISKSTVIIIAPKDAKINASDLSLKCDISEKSDDNTYPIDISVSNQSAWIYSEYTLSLE